MLLLYYIKVVHIYVEIGWTIRFRKCLNYCTLWLSQSFFILRVNSIRLKLKEKLNIDMQ
jgi:hypothetical protein